MKTFLKVIAGFLVLVILIAVGLNIYFTDERLKNTVMPQLNDAVGRTVEVESMSLTFFSSFPQPGISIQKMSIPGTTPSDTLLSLDELIVSVKFFSLMGDQVEIADLKIEKPEFTYIVYPDSSTNIDFLMSTEESTQDTSAGLAVNIPSLRVSGAQFGYRDSTSNTHAQIDDLNAEIALRYADTIESTIDLQVGGVSATAGGTRYLNQLPLSLQQQSTIDLSNENLTLKSGTLSIRGLALNLSGTLSDWSNNLAADLTVSSSSDNFGELLRLVPKEYEEYVTDLNTEGTLSIDGTVNGPLAAEELPQFNLNMQVTDGYLKNPDLPQPIEQIQLTAQANNNLVTLTRFTAQAGENNISANGELSNPLGEDGEFSVEFDGNINLATVSQFYDISEFDIEELAGTLTVEGKANGDRANPEKATFDAVTNLEGGRLKYAEVPKAVENISIDAQANQSKVTINSMALETASNTFSMQGVINHPLEEQQRTIDLDTDLQFDLATIKEFYPIDEDTLKMRGQLSANASLKGKADQIEKAVQSGTIILSNGYINHKSLGKPLEEITFDSKLDGPTLSIAEARIKTGGNNLSLSGSVKDYLSDNRIINFQLNGSANLSEITSYYDLRPTITELTGKADLNLTASGPISKPTQMNFNGTLTAQKVNMDGEGMVQPLKNLDGELNLNPKSVDLNSLRFNLGSSDFLLEGSLKNYMAYLKAEKDRNTTPDLTGSYQSDLLNVDELINWEDTTETEKTPIHLPDLTSSVTANIGELVVTGVSMKKLEAKASTTPKQIELEQASVQLFEGEANGSFTWDVPQPDRTKLTFNGSLDSLQSESFFREYPILGEDSEFHNYISGAFTAHVDYSSELDVYLQPIMETTVMEGDFGMTKARLKEHPLQQKIAAMFNADELRNIALDEWNSTYTLKDNVFTIKDLRLTSGNIGAEMNGTQHLQTSKINYQLKLFLPEKFKGAIASVISSRAVKALTQDNGTIMIPLRVRGTHSKPIVTPDEKAIAPIIKEFLKDKAGNALKKLFDG
ncbi:AsmA family protein [Fodinibius halophilus]|uniref:AsmA family protein n=1 Tax=Fodinibius halophilus TaxID=1736908 RepID=A0A6M1T5U6_9BACT|nr:AsmA-like C-terminal region-containing protein [Fodinibius halophilus]NGP89487.1 AsmA family protein [Fodinibius halophilus]